MKARIFLMAPIILAFMHGIAVSAQRAPRVEFLRDETLRQIQTFNLAIESPQPSVEIYIFAQFFASYTKGDKGALRSGYFEVDGKRLHSWRNEKITSLDLTLTPGTHTITLGLTEPAWLEIFYAQVKEGQTVTQFFEAPAKKGSLSTLKQRIKGLSLDEKRELLRWLAEEVGETIKVK